MDTAPSRAAPTCGWDTVFAVPIARVNQAIIDQKSSPLSFDNTDPDTKFRVQGQFQHWQIRTGGDGALVKLTIPIINLTATSDSGQQWTSPALNATVEVRLTFLTVSEDATIPGHEHHLRVRTSSADPDHDPVASLAPLDWLQNEPPAALKYHIVDGLQDWFNEHIADFEHVFAVATINDEIDHDQWAFVKPRVVSYAYTEQLGGVNPLLGVLAMTQSSNDPVPSDQEISEAAIPAGCQSGFLISPKRMLMDLFLPRLLQIWPDCKINDFEYEADVLQLRTGCGFNMPSFVYEGQNYTPHLETLNVRIQEQQIRIDSQSTTPVSSGITATCTATHFYSITTATNAKGETTLNFQELTNLASEHHDLVKDPAVSSAEEFVRWLSIYGFLCSALLAPFTEGLSLVVGGVVFGLLEGVTELTMSKIQDYHIDDAPAVDALAIQSTSPIIWTGSKDFTLKFAALNTSLQLGGCWNE